MMKEVRKKSADQAINQMLLAAYRRQFPLSWDRAENMQPQCGFGKLSLCCNDCYEGPCRVNPFSAEDEQTICGRTKQELTAGCLLNNIKDGVASLLKLENDFGLTPDASELLDAMTVNDEMLMPGDYAEKLVSLGKDAVTVLKNIRQVKSKMYGDPQPDVTGANLGVLEAETVNIVFHGHVAPYVVDGIKKAAASVATPVNVVAFCGNDDGTIPVITNYDSQEAPLLTGAVDLLVLGNQCVMPATVKLAEQLGIKTQRACALSASGDFAAIVKEAEQAFRARRGKAVNIPEVTCEMCVGYTAANSRELLAMLAKEKTKGLVYLGGCGNIASTQDVKFVKTAEELIAQGYLVVTAGCAGAALAKAGLCHPDYNNGNYPLHGVLPEGIPPVLYLGSCHDAGEFLNMARIADKIPAAAVFAELTHNKVLATAIGFAVAGINTYLGLDSAFSDEGTAGQLGDSLFTKAGARVLPLVRLGENSCNLADAAGDK